ncbi:hypothetical protein GF325_19060 [Candidatus Bathyarchaeota archaeon]|nr:hypothetical protein [Candidatus Bathyarchaeota archaeon]
MTSNQTINTGATKGGPYSHGIKAGNLIFVSGQVGKRDPNTKLMLSSDIETQTRETLEKLKRVLNAGGASVRDIAKMTVFMVNIDDFSKMNEVYEKFLRDNGITEKFPARTTVEVSGLAAKDILIEIDCFAVI